MAEGYTVANAVHSKYDGLYERRAWECSGKPVYQLGDDDGYVLFRPAGQQYWMVGTSNHATSCATDNGHITSSGNGGSCPASPDGGRCGGRWRELFAYNIDGHPHHDWEDAPQLTMSRWCPVSVPCCGVDCGQNGTLVVGGGSEGEEGCGCR